MSESVSIEKVKKELEELKKMYIELDLGNLIPQLTNNMTKLDQDLAEIMKLLDLDPHLVVKISARPHMGKYAVMLNLEIGSLTFIEYVDENAKIGEAIQALRNKYINEWANIVIEVIRIIKKIIRETTYRAYEIRDYIEKIEKLEDMVDSLDP